jgi:hypothetical protein
VPRYNRIRGLSQQWIDAINQVISSQDKNETVLKETIEPIKGEVAKKLFISELRLNPYRLIQLHLRPDGIKGLSLAELQNLLGPGFSKEVFELFTVAFEYQENTEFRLNALFSLDFILPIVHDYQ